MTKPRHDDGKGWKRGAGPYSRSYPKTQEFTEQPGGEIYDRVEYNAPDLPGVNERFRPGFAAEVSKGRKGR